MLLSMEQLGEVDDVAAGAGQTTQSSLRHVPVTEVILKGLIWLA